jgi:spore germination protein YaaH
LVVPAIADYRNKKWDGAVVSRILADSRMAQRHVEAIRELVVRRGFDGIDVDYEHLSGSDRDRFSAFVAALAAELHAHGKLLSVTVHPKSSEPGPQGKNQAQNYAAIGRVADEVRVMLYDYHWDTSKRGALAPMAWIKSTIKFAATQVPPHKLIVGLGTYGYDWIGDRGESLTWQEVRDLAVDHDATIKWDARQQAPWFTYRDDEGRKHSVWFENARSLHAKAALVRGLGLGGIHYWRLGGNDPAIWPARDG